MKNAKKTTLILAAFIGAAAALSVAVGVIQGARPGPASLPSATENLTVTLGNQTFTLVNGVAQRESAPGAAGTETVRVVGDPVGGDATGDGRPDAALLLSDDPGGSGTFYYAVLAVNDGRSWHATNALPLGDRIVPQTISFDDGRFVFRFSERKPGEPMSATPTVAKTVPIRFDAPSGRISAQP